MSHKKHSVSFIKPSEPAFLKKIKESIGYKDTSPTVDTKRSEIPSQEEGEEREDREEERPTVVVLKPEHLTAEQAEEFVKKQHKEEEEEQGPSSSEDRVVFRKPTKRKADDTSSKRKADDTSSKRKADDTSSTSKTTSSEVKTMRKEKNARLVEQVRPEHKEMLKKLLSFDDEADDDC